MNDTILERHELSALFGNMSESELAELKIDVEKNGFAQRVIYLYEGKILDGWHRYQVAVNLNRVDELEFHELGDISNPLGFAMGINYFRRHMSSSHKAVVKALAHESEWMQLGDNQHIVGMQHCTPKSSAQMAKEIQVSKRLMDDAKKVVKRGLANEVIRNNKSISEVLRENNRVKFCLVEPDTFEHLLYPLVPIGHIQKMLHELFCSAGKYAKHLFYIEHPHGKIEFVKCEQCFEADNYDGAGCDTIETYLNMVKSLLTEMENSPNIINELSETPELLNQLWGIVVDSSILVNDAERFLAKNVVRL